MRAFAAASTTRVIQIIEVDMQSLVENLFAVMLSAIVWVVVLELVMASSAGSQGHCLFGVGQLLEVYAANACLLFNG